MRQRFSGTGTGENIRRLMAHKKAARVFPVPVGARIKVDSQRAMAGHPRTCGGVASGNTAVNHCRTAGWNESSGFSGSLLDGDRFAIGRRSLEDWMQEVRTKSKEKGTAEAVPRPSWAPISLLER